MDRPRRQLSILHAHYRFTTFFQLHFLVIVAIAFVRLVGHYRDCREESGSQLFWMYVVYGLTAFAFWFCDFHFCGFINRNLPFNPQGHAWWHVFMGINSYAGPAFAQYIRAKELGYHPIVSYHLRFFPYVTTKPIAL